MSKLTLKTEGETQLVVTRHFAALPEAVFRAHTECELIQKWLLGPDGWTMPVCEIDLRPGGTWHFVWRKQDGKEMSMHGTYIEVNPPDRGVTTENWGGDWPETTNTLSFIEKDGQTTYSINILYSSKEARDAAMKTGMKEGAGQSFDRLEALLASLR